MIRLLIKVLHLEKLFENVTKNSLRQTGTGQTKKEKCDGHTDKNSNPAVSAMVKNNVI